MQANTVREDLVGLTEEVEFLEMDLHLARVLHWVVPKGQLLVTKGMSWVSSTLWRSLHLRHFS